MRNQILSIWFLVSDLLVRLDKRLLGSAYKLGCVHALKYSCIGSHGKLVHEFIHNWMLWLHQTALMVAVGLWIR